MKKRRIKIKNIFLHTALVIRHKWGVFKNCVKCGIPFRGLIHDLSKFSPWEFFESVRFFQGNRSPIGVCRREVGVCMAWLHHRGRNKHHLEYWNDPDCPTPPLMPYKYAVECICDKIAATKTYAKKSYNNSMPLEHWKRYGHRAAANEKTRAFIENVFCDLRDYGERSVLNKNYMKKTYALICLAEASVDES